MISSLYCWIIALLETNLLYFIIIFLYSSSIYELISVLDNVNYMGVLRLAATFLLTSERMYSMYKRFVAKNWNES